MVLTGPWGECLSPCPLVRVEIRERWGRFKGIKFKETSFSGPTLLSQGLKT